MRISVNSFAALSIAVSVYFLLASFDGLAQKFAFAVLNIVFLVCAYSALKTTARKQARPANLVGLSSLGFGAALVILAAQSSAEDADLWLPYGCLIFYAGLVHAIFGTFNPDFLYRPSGYFDMHPVQSISFSFISIAVVVTVFMTLVLALIG